MSHNTEETGYKRAFQPASWVPEKCVEEALHFYQRQYEYLIASQKNGTKNPVVFQHYKAIEILCTDPDLQEFWDMLEKQNYGGNVIVSFTSMFLQYHRKPEISEPQKNKALTDIDNALKQIIVLSNSDHSVQQHMQDSLIQFNVKLSELYSTADETKSSNGKIPVEMICPRSFFQNIRDAIKENETFTHQYYPRNLNEENKAQRVYFIAQTNALIQKIYKLNPKNKNKSKERTNYALVARVLTKILPDLGDFSSDNVRQVVKKSQKPKRSDKN